MAEGAKSPILVAAVKGGHMLKNVLRSIFLVSLIGVASVTQAYAAKECSGNSRLVKMRDGEYCQCTASLYALNSKAGFLQLVSQYMSQQSKRRMKHEKLCHRGEPWCAEQYKFVGADYPIIDLNDNQGGLPAWRVMIDIDDASDDAQMRQLRYLTTLALTYFGKVPTEMAKSATDEVIRKALALPKLTGPQYLESYEKNKDPYAPMGDLAPGVLVRVEAFDVYAQGQAEILGNNLSTVVTPTGCIHAVTPDTQTRP